MLNKLQDDTELLRESGAFWNCIRCCQTFKEGYNEEVIFFSIKKRLVNITLEN